MESSKAPSTFENAPEVYSPVRNEGLIPAIHSDKEVHLHPAPHMYEKQIAEPAENKGSIICGVRRKPFIICMVVASTVVVAALVGGLVGGLTRNRGRTSPQNATEPDFASSLLHSQEATGLTMTTPLVTSSATTSSKISSTITSSGATALQTIVSGLATIVRDCPASNGTRYTANTDPPQTFIKQCSWLFDYKARASNGPFDDLVGSLDSCIDLCAKYNAFNGSGPLGPCYSVCWRHDPNFNDWGRCWGAYEPLPNAQIGGRNASIEHGTDVPVDSAILA